jgi:hypothetical protein
LLGRLKTMAASDRAPWPKDANGAVDNFAGMILAYMAIIQLASNGAVQKRVRAFVPHKPSSRGQMVRDRHQQLRLLVEKDDEYHRRYFTLVKELFPLLMSLLQRLSQRYGWQDILFRTATGKLNTNVYLKLFSLSLHDMLNAGLGLVVGVKHNRSAQALQGGVRSLLNIMQLGSREPQISVPSS